MNRVLLLVFYMELKIFKNKKRSFQVCVVYLEMDRKILV